MISETLVAVGCIGFLIAVMTGIHRETLNKACCRSIIDNEFGNNDQIYKSVLDRAYDNLDINMPNRPTYNDIKAIHGNKDDPSDKLARIRNTQRIAVNSLIKNAQHILSSTDTAQSFLSIDSRGPLIQTVPGARLSSLNLPSQLQI